MASILSAPGGGAQPPPSQEATPFPEALPGAREDAAARTGDTSGADAGKDETTKQVGY